MSIDALIHSVLSPTATRRMPFRFPFRRRPVEVRGLTIGELLEAAARHPRSAEVIWATVGLVPMPKETTADDQKVLFSLVRLAVGANDPASVVRLLRLSEADLTRLLRSIVDLTTPSDTDELFRPMGDDAPRRDSSDELEGAWSKPSVVLSKVAFSLQARGFGDVLSWTPGRLLYVQSVLGEEDYRKTRRDLVVAGYGSRLGQATDQGFKSTMNELQGG